MLSPVAGRGSPQPVARGLGPPEGFKRFGSNFLFGYPLSKVDRNCGAPELALGISSRSLLLPFCRFSGIGQRNDLLESFGTTGITVSHVRGQEITAELKGKQREPKPTDLRCQPQSLPVPAAMK